MSLFMPYERHKFPPGHYKYWKGSYLNNEVYITVIDHFYYYYYLDRAADGKYYTSFSNNGPEGKRSLIEKDGKIFTPDGIYLFTPALQVKN